MILISHRGNITGKQPELENDPNYIREALDRNYDVEIDVWHINGIFLLGHDIPQYELPNDLLLNFSKKLWIHCKNIEAIIKFKQEHPLSRKLNYFWHEKDTITLTSKNYIWAYPGKQPIMNSIAVMPEINNDNLSICSGICSDYIKNYKK